MALFIMGGNVKTRKLCFCWQNRSKLVHTPSIYAGYTTQGGLLKKIFSPKIQQQKKLDSLFFHLQWGPIVNEKI